MEPFEIVAISIASVVVYGSMGYFTALAFALTFGPCGIAGHTDSQPVETAVIWVAWPIVLAIAVAAAFALAGAVGMKTLYRIFRRH